MATAQEVLHFRYDVGTLFRMGLDVVVMPAQRNALGLWEIDLDLDVDRYPGWSVVAEVDDSGPVGEVVRLSISRIDYAHAIKRDFTDDPRAQGGVTGKMLASISTVQLMTIADSLLSYVTPTRLSDPRKRKRTRLSADDERWWANLARDYVRLSKSSRRPVVDLADKYGVDRDRMRDILHDARRAGWLTRGGQGQARGELTQRSLMALGLNS